MRRAPLSCSIPSRARASVAVAVSVLQAGVASSSGSSARGANGLPVRTSHVRVVVGALTRMGTTVGAGPERRGLDGRGASRAVLVCGRTSSAALLIPTRGLVGPIPSACAEGWGTAPSAALACLSDPERVRSAHQRCSSVALRCRWATQFSVADCIVSSTHLALWMLGSSRPSSTCPIHVAEWSTGVLVQSLCIGGGSLPPSCLFAPRVI